MNYGREKESKLDAKNLQWMSKIEADDYSKNREQDSIVWYHVIE